MELYTLKQILKQIEKEVRETESFYKDNMYCSFKYLLDQCEEKENDLGHLFNQKIWESGSLDLNINIFGTSILVYNLGPSPSEIKKMLQRLYIEKQEEEEFGGEI